MPVADEPDENGLLRPSIRKAIPGPAQTLADMISIYEDGDRQFMVGKERTLTYRQMEAEVDAAAAAYMSLGLRPGDRVAAIGPSDCELSIAFLATQRGGLVWVGINKILAGPEKLFQIEDSGAVLLLADSESLAQLVGKLPRGVVTSVIDGPGASDWPAMVMRHMGATRPDVEIDPFAPSAIGYTSGTTGNPKGAVHSQHNLMTISVAGHQLIGTGNWQPGLQRGVPLPHTILNAMAYAVQAALVGGGSIVFFDRGDILSIVPVVENKNVEVLGTSATTIFDLINRPELAGRALKNLRYVWGGGSFVAESLKIEFRERYGSELIEDYGLTEAPTSIVSGRANQKAPPGAVGWPHPHLRVCALSLDFQELPVGETGELAVRATKSGPWADVYTPMLGYWRRPEATAETIVSGWLLTGDLGYLDEQGCVFIVGRKKDVIVRGGANIYPAEVERVLRLDERIEDAVVVGHEDARLGEMAVAYLHLRVDLEQARTMKEDLVRQCREQLALYKIPERWIVVQTIPRNSMRKPVKSALRAASGVEI